MTYETGEYEGWHGRIWFCVAHQKEGRMICNSKDGHYTVADFETFARWGWTPSVSRPPSGDAA